MVNKASDLCRDCGLCCNGTFLADIELSNQSEADGMEVLGLEVESEDGYLLKQPCRALKGRLCQIYSHRPDCCRSFKCALLNNVEQSKINFELAVELIDGVHAARNEFLAICGQVEGLNLSGSIQDIFTDAFSLLEDMPGHDQQSEKESLVVAHDRLVSLVRSGFLWDGY